MRLVLIICIALLPYAYGNTASGVIRHAIIAGANNGGHDRIELKYADDDARSVYNVFTTLGGLPTENAHLLIEPNAEELLQALAKIRDRISAVSSEEQSTNGQRIEFIFYYSGHSDEKSLLIGEETVPYTQLKNELALIEADVTVAILDSCASGAFTRLKGGTHVKPFLINTASEVNGHAFLASSSADEAAQESDSIGGAYFTHYMVSALRGAGDLSNDSKITLNEAYQFAFNETLARTEGSQHGAQHAAFNMQLSGEGDLVLTDLNQTSGELILAEEILGRIYIRDARGHLMVELQKRELKPLKIGLEPGEYRVTLENEGHVSRNERFEVNEGVSRLGQSDLKLLVPSAVRVRGTNGLGAGVDALTMKLSFTKKLSSPSYHPDQRQLVNWDFNLLGNETYSISGLSLGALITHTQTDTRGAQIAGIYNRIEGDLQGVALAGLLNKIDGEVRNGLAVSGVSNVTSNLKNAAQISGALNYVGDLEKGAQVSGAVNIANHIENGSQISPVNIANDIKGTQIGLVNIARKLDGPAIGLFNLIGNGRHGISLRNNEINVPSLELKLGSKRTYTEFSIGQNWDDEIASFGLAFGVRMLNTSRHFFEADVGQIQLVKPQLCIVCDYETSKDSTDKSFMRVRLNLGQKVTKNLTLVGGLSINGSLGYWNDEFWAYQPIENFNEDYLSNALAIGKNGRTWVGYSYGLEFVF